MNYHTNKQVKKLYLLIACFFVFWRISAQQQILLMTETFDLGPSSFYIDSSGVGTNTGNNDWVINNSYSGAPNYPDTKPEDSVVSGQISGAPHSNYLHITDLATANGGGPSNANWDPSTPSDHFTYLGSSFCTLGFTNVIFTFFWLCEGDSNAYGQLYYRANGGAWTPTGQPKYYNQSIWKYETVHDPAFDNVNSLQLGFRWLNTAEAIPGTKESFAIDDIIAVGTYDSINHPVTMHIDVLDTLICQGNQIYFNMTLSQSICDANYDMQLSDANGSFANPHYLGSYELTSGFTSGFLATLGTPGNLLGTCFKLRVVKTTPAPVIVSDTSICIHIQFCPNVIFNLKAPVMDDIDTTCILSEIDVKFNSLGVFHSGNKYIAELSDSTGSFADSTYLGQLAVTDSFPSMPPGSISGLIPATVPPGCNYYIRVRSTNPVAVSAPLGPYCLTNCDVLTNNHQDLHNCVQSGPYPLCDTININRNHWNGDATYDTCNNWTVELRSMMDFSFVADFTAYHDTAGGNYIFCMPSTADSLPVAPGSYYMRIVSNCSSEPWNQTGTVIRITIGAPNAIPPLITLNDSVFCPTELIQLFVSPFNHPPSDYEWSSNLVNNGNSFIWPYDPLQVALNPNTLQGTYKFYVREINFGCVGPSSAPAEVTVIGKPNVAISGPILVCLGDTVTYNVSYLPRTYYDWTAPPGVKVLVEGNSEVSMIFDTLGTFTISNFSLNNCGQNTGYYTVKVTSLYDLNIGNDQTICPGTPTTLSTSVQALDKVFSTKDTVPSTTQPYPGAMFNIIAHADVVIDSFAVQYLSASTQVQEEIYGKPGSYRGYEQNSGAWSMITSYYNFLPNPVGQMTVIPAAVIQPITAGDTFAFYVTTINSGPAVNQAYSPGIGGQQGTVYKTDGIIDFVQGTINRYPFGLSVGPKVLNMHIYYSTKSGLHYAWNTGDTTSTIIVSPTTTGKYVAIVYDTSGCRAQDTVLITVKPAPAVYAGPDTLICPGSGYPFTLTTSAVDSVSWSPAAGLDNANTLHPNFNYNQSQQYVITAYNGIPGECDGHDTVNIKVYGVSVNGGADTTICDGATLNLNATSSTANILWTPASGLSSDTSHTPTFTGTETTQYLVSATDSGCTVVDTVIVTVDECNLQVPNAFTPNGDGTNDHFTVFYGNSTSGDLSLNLDYEIRIYNRWGEQVYYSHDAKELNNLDKGWDGTFKGKLQDVGTFVYYVTVKVHTSGKTEHKKGNLTLIR